MRMFSGREGAVRIAAGILLGLCTIGLISAQEISPSKYSEMKWRMIGPFRAGKVNAVAGLPGNPAVYYFAAGGAGGGENKGRGDVCKQDFDKKPTGSIGAMSAVPSDHEVVITGTGV